jgi:hypothetical protein
MVTVCVFVAACANRPDSQTAPHTFSASQVIDLGAVVTEDLPQQFWGKAFMKQMGFMKQNSFDVITGTFPPTRRQHFWLERVLHEVRSAMTHCQR